MMITIPEWSSLQLFLVATIVLLLTPGPAVLYILARSMHQGRRAGVVSAMGVGVGNFCQVIAATMGISALLLSSSLAFHLLKTVGAVYLIYLGIRTLYSRQGYHQPESLAIRSLSRIFVQGIVVNIFNPKTAVFFFAFLPQFVTPERGAVSMQIFFLGWVFVVLGLLSDSGYALLAGTLRKWIKPGGWSGKASRYGTGSIYIALGVTTALTRAE